MTTPVHFAVTQSMGPLLTPETDLSKVLYKVTTHYRPDAWWQALQDAGITLLYPNLVHDLIHGSPIGNPPPIDFTFIPRNLPSANIRPEYISSLIAQEVVAGCMDGPFSVDEAHVIYGGHFRTCPLGLVQKPGSAALCMICHFSKLDQFSGSTNGWVNSDDFPTSWYSAAQMADFMGVSFFS